MKARKTDRTWKKPTRSVSSGDRKPAGKWPSQKFIARRHHTTEANLHNWLKKHGLKSSLSHPVV